LEIFANAKPTWLTDWFCVFPEIHKLFLVPDNLVRCVSILSSDNQKRFAAEEQVK
jgi:hypothetical protein